MQLLARGGSTMVTVVAAGVDSAPLLLVLPLYTAISRSPAASIEIRATITNGNQRTRVHHEGLRRRVEAWRCFGDGSSTCDC